MMIRLTKLALAAVLSLTVASAVGDERTELLRLRVTTVNLINMLVEEGVISRDKADQLIERAQQSADQEVNAAQAAAAPAQATAQPANKTEVRVPYVPEFIQDRIREQVRAEVRDDVVRDVVKKAKDERWGTPEALPDWLSRISLYGDFRLRYQGDYFASDNLAGSYFNYQQINQSGGVTKAGLNAFLNVTSNDNRMRERLRLGMNARINDSLRAGIRITTGNTSTPVSTNQTLGNTANRYAIVLDESYLEYLLKTGAGNKLEAWGGRFPNPFYSTDLVWDTDVNFEGGALSWHEGAVGYLRGLYATVGGFIVQSEQQYCSTKYLYGAQLGGDWTLGAGADASRLKVGLAWYDYAHIYGIPNLVVDSHYNDCTAPQYIQKGNSMMRISNDTGETSGDPRRVGLASDFNILNLTASYDVTASGPVHLVLTADYARNLGFDRAEILQRTGEDIRPRVNGYQFIATLGHLKVERRNDWQAFGGYKWLERDAVLDAFTDSDFHGGGTDAKGWFLGANYGLMKDAWLAFRLMSTDAIDGPPLGLNTVQLDLNARF